MTALGLVGLLPAAVLAAAIVVPILTCLYLYDVDVYEDEPLLVLGLTIAWGAAMGGVIGLVGRLLGPSTIELLKQSTWEALLEQGVVLPLLSLSLALVGPLALLVYPRFNDVLDGTTFGAVSAVWLMATQLLTQSSSLFDDGLRLSGSPWGWTMRLVDLTVALPLLWAGVAGATAGAFWLRFRAPIRDRDALGLLGHPAAAAALGGGAVTAAASIHVLFDIEVAVAFTMALALLALVWMRRAIHIGLVEEAREVEIGPTIACANCGRSTPRHTFCGVCGIALGALPKGPTRRAAAPELSNQESP